MIASGNRGFYRQLEIGIIEYNKRIRATQFQYALFQRRPSLSANRRAGAHATGHRHRRDSRIVNHLTHALIIGVHPSIDASGSTGFRQDSGYHLRATRDIGRMF
ncbi:Uncharacterised protein [Salmonella enterica subsp. enterica serovar Bovismorbificans]|uniref:Uncharacterized protein n=1 Tax=Salmonella enterica subsp. enterica serovar Bovismorbificans TaxID=58097 RepID=A0A655CRW6_SALET|nr:Uncharacterised protein [Salmonella enterica subsp. enterica serovar Bovismorbificans]